jgi:lipopolysaccharide export system permease protein
MLTFFIVTFLLQMQFLWKYIDDLVGKGLTFVIVAELLVYASATFVPLALPLAILLASLMTFGGLGENYELTAMKAAGISLTKIMYPLIILMLTISIAAFYYSNISLPYFNWKMRSLLYDIQQKRPELQIKEGVFYNGIENYSIKIGKKDINTNLIHDIRIYDHTANDGNVSVTLADSGYMKMTADKRALVITLFKGESYVDVIDKEGNRYGPKTYPFRRDIFMKQVINIPLEGFDFQRSDEGLFRSNFQMMNLKQLEYATDSMKRDLYFDRMSLTSDLLHSSYYPRTITGKPDTSKKVSSKPFRFNLRYYYYLLSDYEKVIALSNALNDLRNAKSSVSNDIQNYKNKSKRMRRHEIEWHKKFTLSLACFIFFFIGAPLGAIIRKGGLGLPLVISVLFFVLYYVISLTGEKFVRESYIPAYIGVWISSIILFPLGAFLTYKASHDSSFMSIDAYYKLINKFKNFSIKNLSFKKTEETASK